MSRETVRFKRHDRLVINEHQQYEILPHFHESLEIVLVTEGTFEASANKSTYSLMTGDVIAIFPGIINAFHLTGEKPVRAYHFHIAPAFWGPYSALLSGTEPDIPYLPAGQVPADIPVLMRKLLETSAAELDGAGAEDPREHPPLSDVMGGLTRQNLPGKCHLIWKYSAVQMILSILLPCFSLRDRKEIPDGSLVDKAVHYLALNYQEPLTLSSMAHDLGVSPYSLSRIFSGTLHESFNDYLNDLRLNYASFLLSGTSESITEIMLNSGFQSQATFNRAFHAKYGMTPREYRSRRGAL